MLPVARMVDTCRVTRRVATVPASVVALSALLVLTGDVLVAAGRVASQARSTRLESAAQVTVRGPDGSEHAGRPGEDLPDGAMVRTGPVGAGVLRTGDRSSALGAATVVTVAGPREQILRAGSLVVARRRGPPLTVLAGAVRVDDLHGVTRVRRDFSVRVGAYSQDGSRAHLSVGPGTTLDLARLHETEVAGAALPRLARPLRLRDDTDRAADPGLAALDSGLVRLAARVDADPLALAVFRPASAVASGTTAGTTTGTPSGTPSAAGPVGPPVEHQPPLSESALSLAIAQAARPVVPPEQALLLRSEEAPWGVVAALLGAPLDGVDATLAALMRGGPITVAAAPPLPVPGLLPPLPAPAPAAAPPPPTAALALPAAASTTGVAAAPAASAAGGPPGGAPSGTGSTARAPAAPGTASARPTGAHVSPSPSAPPSPTPAPSRTPGPGLPLPPAPVPVPTPGPVGSLLAPVTTLLPAPVVSLLPPLPTSPPPVGPLVPVSSPAPSKPAAPSGSGAVAGTVVALVAGVVGGLLGTSRT